MIFLFGNIVCQKFSLNAVGGRDINKRAYLIIPLIWQHLNRSLIIFIKLNIRETHVVHVYVITFTSFILKGLSLLLLIDKKCYIWPKCLNDT